MSRVPPTPMDRLRLFCSLVDQYDELAETLPVDQNSFTVSSGARPLQDHWHRVIRAAALRKFVLDPHDEVRVAAVLDALVECLRDPADRGVVDGLRAPIDDAWLRYVTADGAEFTAEELTRDLIYGGLLHGDYDRWIRTSEQDWMTIDLACWQFTTGCEYYVRRVRDVILAADREDRLVTPLGTVLYGGNPHLGFVFTAQQVVEVHPDDVWRSNE